MAALGRLDLARHGLRSGAGHDLGLHEGVWLLVGSWLLQKGSLRVRHVELLLLGLSGHQVRLSELALMIHSLKL